MGIEAKRRGWELCKIQIDEYKAMTTEGARKIKTLVLEIFMPSEIDSQKYKILKETAQDCPVKINLEASIDIKLNWHKTKN